MAAARAIVYLNGRFLGPEEAMVPANDRGFLFGDGVYEVIPAYGGHLCLLDAHLARLERSLDAVRIPHPLSRAEWRHLLPALVARNGGGDRAVYLQVTRGVAPRREHVFPEPQRPTVYASADPLEPLDATALSNGIAAVTRHDVRWERCDIKTTALLANVLLRQEARDAGATEAILTRNGVVTEGAASNVFIAVDGTVITPPKGPNLLPGITRDLVLQLARDAGIPCLEDTVQADALARAGELWITSSTKGVLPVTRLDGARVGSGRPGPLWQQVHGAFETYKSAVASGVEPARSVEQS